MFDNSVDRKDLQMFNIIVIGGAAALLFVAFLYEPLWKAFLDRGRAGRRREEHEQDD